MIIEMWNTILYYPLINVLIFLYNTLAGENIVVAVILLTIALRLVLLPLSIVGERNKLKFQEYKPQFDEIEKKFKNDPEQKKIEIRKLLKKAGMSPWAKVIVLGVQVLVFFLLYTVFIGGVRGKISEEILYSWVALPDAINTDFMGFNAAEQSAFWAGLTALVIFWGIHKEHAQRKGKLSKNEQYYAILFPLSVFIFAWIIPMVKSIFILTSLLFSATVASFGKMFATPDKK